MVSDNCRTHTSQPRNDQKNVEAKREAASNVLDGGRRQR